MWGCMISSNTKQQHIDLSHSSVWDTINLWVPDPVLWDPLKASAEGTWEQTSYTLPNFGHAP